MNDHDELTPREQQVMELVALGCDNKEICEALNIAYPTLRCHLATIYGKFRLTCEDNEGKSSIRVKATLLYFKYYKRDSLQNIYEALQKQYNAVVKQNISLQNELRGLRC